ncbi:hypothetical protein PIB30_090206 [Stylosanthes scabra]|uniref:Uncharacterized protein n=1 Tax=Stylosanthes scabra TaxID=79078 RepID=A0ABU6XTW5_9FABA|nr:hypothetical protein [Stylosanthes scabra]
MPRHLLQENSKLAHSRLGICVDAQAWLHHDALSLVAAQPHLDFGLDSAKNKAIMDELATVRSRQEEFFSNQTNQYNMIRQEQKLLGKEILDVKKYQMSTVTMGVKLKSTKRQLKELTRNASARECYTVWAHQQANPNLVEMPVHKVTKQIYDNTNNNRPMFHGFLKSDLPPSKTAPPPPKSNDPQNAPK